MGELLSALTKSNIAQLSQPEHNLTMKTPDNRRANESHSDAHRRLYPNQNQQRGRATAQHEQVHQQAVLTGCTEAVDAMAPRPTRVDAFYGCQHPPQIDWLREMVDATFLLASRIEIETWSFPEEEELCD